MKTAFVSIFFFSGLFLSIHSEGKERLSVDLGPEQAVFNLTVTDGIVEGRMEIPKLELSVQALDSVEYLRIIIDGFRNQGLLGSPELPGMSGLFEKAAPGDYHIALTMEDSVVIDLNENFAEIDLFPYQPSSLKSEPALSVHHPANSYKDGGDQWISLPIARINEEGIIRGVRLGMLTLSPVLYHPVRHQLKVYTKIGFRCEPVSAALTNRREIESLPFRSVLSGVAMNSNSNSIREEKVISTSPITMVILSDSIFHTPLQPLIDWKREKGFHVIEAYTEDPAVGEDAESIKTFLGHLYNNPSGDTMPPTYLLIVGDVEYVPPSTGSFPITDLYYTTMDGPADYLPELFCGRLPAKTDTELEAMIEKILQYEKFRFHDPSFLEKTILIAGNDWRGYTEGNGQLNYGTTYYFNATNGINASAYLHPEASSLDSEIRQEINAGAGFVNYTGHGTHTGWVDPAFRMSHINALTNTGKYPLVIGNGCETNVFNLSGDCFAEAIVKAPNKGALAYIGCTADSYWEEDFYWAVGVGEISANPNFSESGAGLYDRIFHLNGEPVENWASSIGEMIFAGNMAVQGSTSAYKEYYWRIYQLMGDPSIIPWFGIPGNPPVDFPASLPQGAAVVDIQAQAYDYAAISSGGRLLDATHADGEGIAELFIPETYRDDTLMLVVTGDRRAPFIRQIPDPGYFQLVGFALDGESVEDGKLANGETASLALKLKNLSEIVSSPDSLVVRYTGQDIVFIDTTVYLPQVDPGDTVSFNNVFSFQVSEFVKDQDQVIVSLIRRADATGNMLIDTLRLHAPQLRLVSFTSGDFETGNGNGILEAGETIEISMRVKNFGSMTSDSILFRLSDQVEYFSESLLLKAAPLAPGADTTYTTTLDIPAEYATQGAISFPVYSGDGIYLMDTTSLVIGKYFEDFASRSLDRIPWTLNEWDIDTIEFFNAPAALKSAAVENYESTAVSVFVHVFDSDSLSFMIKVSSEENYDFLKVYVNGQESDRWSGETGWTSVKLDLAEGLHEITWSYEKDQSKSEGLDAAWIDQVIFPEQAFVRTDLAAEQILFTGSPPFSDTEDFSIRVRNYGLDTATSYEVRYRLDQSEWNSQEVNTEIPPGAESTIVVVGELDLAGVGLYQLKTAVAAGEDNFPSNDTLSAFINHYAFPDVGVTLQGTDSSANDHVDILVRFENLGNIHVSEVDYTVVIDESFSFTGRDVLDLQPGAADEKRIVLINNFQDWITRGWHDFRLEIGTDSLLTNNSIEGMVYWNPTGWMESGISQFAFAPNPAGSEIVLTSNGVLQQDHYVVISDLTGRVLIHDEITSVRQIIRLEERLPSAGLYLLEIRTGAERVPAGKLLYLPER